MYQKTYHIHFVGIGGIGMSGIAELLLNLGYRVSGSDLKSTDITRRLADLGGTIHTGHNAANVGDADVVVISSAVKEDNDEVAAARNRSIPVIPRAEMLAELMRLKYSVAVAGAHGKTTTTSMVGAVLAAGSLDPTIVIGGKLRSVDTNAVLGQGNYIVAEADESDGSFLKMAPTIAVVTNIDREHLDFYDDLDAIVRTFARFIDRIPFYGLAVLCLDNEHVQNLIPHIKKRYMTYGVSSQADFQAREIHCDGLSSRYQVYHRGQHLGDVRLNLPGIHNVYNSLAGIAVGMELNIPFATIRSALETLEGVRRRLEIKGASGGITVIDDYAHHPTEIKTTLQSARSSWPDHRIVGVFQPHRYTRTQALFDDFTRAFYETDQLILLPIYSAGEAEIAGISHTLLCEGIQAHGHKDVTCTDSFEAALDVLQRSVREGDIVMTMGAGDIWKLGETFLKTIT
jgi:UDP-N-acetylmuramate--alanine ligase